jgi:hypothetical protein
VADVEGEELRGPLKGCYGVVGGAIGGSGVGGTPKGVGARDEGRGVCDGGAEGMNGGRVREGKECFRWEYRVKGTGDEAGAKRKGRAGQGEGAEAAEVINGERYEADVVLINGVDGGFCTVPMRWAPCEL